MKNKIICLLLIPLYLISAPKDDEKMCLLKKRLSEEIASLEKKKTQIENLEKQISSLEYSRIQKRVEEWEKRIQSVTSLPPSYQTEGANLFFKERKALTDILEQNPNESLAQDLLDRILRLITFLNRSPEIN